MGILTNFEYNKHTQDKVFKKILVERPEDMSFKEFKKLRTLQNKEIKRYLGKSTRVSSGRMVNDPEAGSGINLQSLKTHNLKVKPFILDIGLININF